MDARIKQLAEQADIHGDSYLLYQHRLEKFAELLVSDCALALSQLANGGTSAELYYTYCSTFNKYLGIKP